MTKYGKHLQIAIKNHYTKCKGTQILSIFNTLIEGNAILLTILHGYDTKCKE